MLSVKKEDFLEDLIDEVADTTQRKRGKYVNTFQNQFTNRRINAKYIELANRYAQFTDDDEIFGQMVAIIMELVKDKEYIKISKTGRNDEISWLITTTEQRMWDYIQKNYTMNFISYKNGGQKIRNHFVHFEDDGTIESNGMVYLDDYTYVGDGGFVSNHEIYEIGDTDPTEYEYMLGLQNLNNLMDLCKLRTTQKDLVLLLEQTRDNSKGIYNLSDAAKAMGVSRQSVSKSWLRIQKRMYDVLQDEYAKTNAEKALDLIDDMIDSAEYHHEVLQWVKDNFSNEYVFDVFYRLDAKTRRVLIRAMRHQPVHTDYYHNEMILFLRELHETRRRLERTVDMT